GAGHDALEDAGWVDLLELDVLAVARVHLHVGSRRAQRPYDDTAVVGVGAEDRVRVAVLAAHEPLEIGGGHDHSSSNRRTIERTGIETQSGRLSSSYCSSYTAFSSSNTDSSFCTASCPGGSRLGSTARK